MKLFLTFAVYGVMAALLGVGIIMALKGSLWLLLAAGAVYLLIFSRLEIGVNRDVLVPRSETELLAEMGWKFLGEKHPTSNIQHPTSNESSTALDFGTGSGCIAIALAVKCPSVRVTALEVSPEAL